MTSRAIVFAFFFCLTVLVGGQLDRKPARLELSPCDLPGVNEKVRCGTYEVFEDRAARKGRKIALKVVVFPATGPTREPDPFVYIPGGPGSSATEDAPGVARQFAAIRARKRARLLAIASLKRRRRAKLALLVAVRARKRSRLLALAALKARRRARLLAVAAVRSRRRLRMLKRATAGAELRQSA